METILGKFPAIFNGHQPPRADYPYELVDPSSILDISDIVVISDIFI